MVVSQKVHRFVICRKVIDATQHFKPLDNDDGQKQRKLNNHQRNEIAKLPIIHKSRQNTAKNTKKQQLF